TEASPPELDGDTVWLNCVGTFGVGSASYWWSRLGAALVRALHYVLGHSHALWQLLYSDDECMTGRGQTALEPLLAGLLCMEVLGVPVAWEKVQGGVELDYIGFWLVVARFQVGLSERRAAWAVDWLKERVRTGTADGSDFCQAVGRLGFIAGALQHTAAFLGPAFAWAAACPVHGGTRLPAMVRLVFLWLAEELSARRLTDCRGIRPPHFLGELFRVDAKAQGLTVCLGGWYTGPDPCAKTAAWFSVQLTPETAPWAYEKGPPPGEPFRAIASLELLAVLVATVTLLPEDMVQGVRGHVGFAAGTDIQGTGAVIAKRVSATFPHVCGPPRALRPAR
ncbi:MAG: hypothetical protein VX463_00690, partial [Pseudomonadota bacterium]|nr:hypothetical protein [Pseudomonadota bacterium]